MLSGPDGSRYYFIYLYSCGKQFIDASAEQRIAKQRARFINLLSNELNQEYYIVIILHNEPRKQAHTELFIQNMFN